MQMGQQTLPVLVDLTVEQLVDFIAEVIQAVAAAAHQTLGFLLLVWQIELQLPAAAAAVPLITPLPIMKEVALVEVSLVAVAIMAMFFLKMVIQVQVVRRQLVVLLAIFQDIVLLQQVL